MFRFPVAILVLAFTLVAIVGCGSKEEGDAPSPSRAQVIKRANDICEQMEAQQLKEFAKYAKAHPEVKKELEAGKTQHEQELVEAVGLPPIESAVEEIKALGAPSGDEAKVEAVVSEIEAGIETAKDEPEVFFSSVKDNPFTHANQLAADYGFTRCTSFP